MITFIFVMHFGDCEIGIFEMELYISIDIIISLKNVKHTYAEPEYAIQWVMLFLTVSSKQTAKYGPWSHEKFTKSIKIFFQKFLSSTIFIEARRIQYSN